MRIPPGMLIPTRIRGQAALTSTSSDSPKKSSDLQSNEAVFEHHQRSFEVLNALHNISMEEGTSEICDYPTVIFELGDYTKNAYEAPWKNLTLEEIKEGACLSPKDLFGDLTADLLGTDGPFFQPRSSAVRTSALIEDLYEADESLGDVAGNSDLEIPFVT
jgi:hypothetical protein